MLNVWKNEKEMEREEQTYGNENGQIVGLEKERNHWEWHGVNAKEDFGVFNCSKQEDMKKDTFNDMNTIIIWTSFKKTPRITLITSQKMKFTFLQVHKNTSALIHTRLFLTHMRNRCVDWHWQLLMTHPMTLTSTPSINQTHPLSLSFNPHSTRPGMRP